MQQSYVKFGGSSSAAVQQGQVAAKRKQHHNYKFVDVNKRIEIIYDNFVHDRQPSSGFLNEWTSLIASIFCMSICLFLSINLWVIAFTSMICKSYLILFKLRLRSPLKSSCLSMSSTSMLYIAYGYAPYYFDLITTKSSVLTVDCACSS